MFTFTGGLSSQSFKTAFLGEGYSNKETALAHSFTNYLNCLNLYQEPNISLSTPLEEIKKLLNQRSLGENPKISGDLTSDFQLLLDSDWNTVRLSCFVYWVTLLLQEPLEKVFPLYYEIYSDVSHPQRDRIMVFPPTPFLEYVLLGAKRGMSYPKNKEWFLEKFRKIYQDCNTLTDLIQSSRKYFEVNNGAASNTGALHATYFYYREPMFDLLYEGDEETKDLVSLLSYEKQLILQGPPGTGKTRLAKEIAKVLTNENKKGAMKLLQFHPSYTYEDFVVGLEVSTHSGSVSYKVRAKGIKSFAEIASLHPDQSYVLILDEINRAPVASVLGELMYALEYRGSTIHLPYGETLTIPSNLYVIGTMNTADRSIGTMDYAMQRRFSFHSVLPQVPKSLPDGKIFATTLFQKVSALFSQDNIASDVNPRDISLGTSYFICRSDPSNPEEIYQAHLEYKVEYEILPLLLEYYKDDMFKNYRNLFQYQGRTYTFGEVFQDYKLQLKLKDYFLGKEA